MPTKVTIESGTSLDAQYEKALERLAEKWRMKHPRWKWRKGVQQCDETRHELEQIKVNAEGKGGKVVS